ncbi:MAG: HAD family hydrolase [Anaerolineae bacterium]|nr:HAD family hydrolase [Anaerolineae bacterium]
MPIQGIIFDLGHTLMHLDDTWSAIFDRGVVDLIAFLAVRRPDLDGPAFARAWLDRRRDGFDRAKATLREVTAVETMRWTFAQAGVPDPDLALVTGAIDAFFAYEDACWFPDPDALPVLQELSGRGLRLGLFSNATHDPFIQNVVDRLGFRPYLDPVLSSGGVGVRKPDPAAFAPCLAAWSLLPGSVVVVGDSLEHDTQGAHRAGIRAVWYRSRENARQEGGGYGDEGAPDRIRPEAVIERLSDLPACLDLL